jgi:hypothetical protein
LSASRVTPLFGTEREMNLLRQKIWNYSLANPINLGTASPVAPWVEFKEIFLMSVGT